MDVATGRKWSRQLSAEEAAQYSIAVHEARALLFCVQNIEISDHVRVLRIHCGKFHHSNYNVIKPNRHP